MRREKKGAILPAEALEPGKEREEGVCDGLSFRNVIMNICG